VAFREGPAGFQVCVARAAITTLALLVLLTTGCAGPNGAADNQPDTTDAPEGNGELGVWVSAGGLRRTYQLYVPPTYDGSRPWPVIVAFHGAGGTHRMAEDTGLFRAAERGGFIVAAPDGVLGNWALPCGPCTPPGRLGIDDVAFVATLVDHLAAPLLLDRARIYAAGMSNGGSFAHQLACAYPLAGAAVVAGTMFRPDLCHPQRPVSIVAFHGTEDDVVPFVQGSGPVQLWTVLDGCDPDYETTPLPDRVDDDTTVTRYDHVGCEGGSAVRFYTVEGGGHTWPGAPGGGGKKTYDIEASEEIVDFFTQYGGPS